MELAHDLVVYNRDGRLTAYRIPSDVIEQVKHQQIVSAPRADPNLFFSYTLDPEQVSLIAEMSGISIEPDPDLFYALEGTRA